MLAVGQAGGSNEPRGEAVVEVSKDRVEGS